MERISDAGKEIRGRERNILKEKEIGGAVIEVRQPRRKDLACGKRCSLSRGRVEG